MGREGNSGVELRAIEAITLEYTTFFKIPLTELFLLSHDQYTSVLSTELHAQADVTPASICRPIGSGHKDGLRSANFVIKLPMPKSKIDKVREERIRNEIIVDCYNESERFSGWYCYLEEKLKFPFSALCVATSPASPLKRGEQVKVIGMLDDERDESGEIFARIRWRGRRMGAPLAQLEGVHLGPESEQAIADWHYWCLRGYRF
jgi:hypothetical protein